MLHKYEKEYNEYIKEIEKIEIEGKSYTAPKRTSKRYEVTNIPNPDISGFNEISDHIKEQERTYTYTASNTGTYAFYFLAKGCEIALDFTMKDEEGNIIADKYYARLVKVELEEGKKYIISISLIYEIPLDREGDYTMYICLPRQDVDISGYEVINDNIEYEDQEIRYKYTASSTSYYEFIEKNSENNLIDTEIVDELNNTIGYNNANLEAGRNYFIVVNGHALNTDRYGDLGSFKIIIMEGKQVRH